MEIETQCPYCGETITVWVDAGGGRRQRYVEDCAVCCRPIEIGAYADDEGDFQVDAGRGDAGCGRPRPRGSPRRPRRRG